MKKFKFSFYDLNGICDSKTFDMDTSYLDHVLTCKVENIDCHIYYSSRLNDSYLTIDQLREIVSLGTLMIEDKPQDRVSSGYHVFDYNIHIELTEDQALYLQMKYGHKNNFSGALIYE